MSEDIKGRCKYALTVSFNSINSMDDLIKFMEDINQKKNELGIVSIKWIEERALDKAAHLVERKAKKQHERKIALSDERSFSSIIEMFLK